MSELASLLARVAHIQSVYEAFCKREESSFNVFSLCSVDHYEVMHSRILAEFLNPQGTHGMNAAFLKSFMETPTIRSHLEKVKGFPLANIDKLDTANVQTEEAYENGRCDITIHWQGWCIVIENKIFAADQHEQLIRYDSDVRKQEIPIIFYLTLDGHKASQDSAGNVLYCPISYKSDIADWIKDCSKISYDRPFVRESLCQYRNLVMKLSGNQKEHKMSEDIIKEITATSAWFKAAKSVVELMQKARAEVARVIMTDLCKALSDSPNFSGWKLMDQALYKFVDDDGHGHKYWHGFKIDKELEEGRYFCLYCEFQDKGSLSNLFFGVCRGSDHTLSQQFLETVSTNSELKAKRYEFYPEDSPGWIYGAYPEKELRFWTDETLARLIDQEQRKEFVCKIMKRLSTMLEESKNIVATIEHRQQK